MAPQDARLHSDLAAIYLQAGALSGNAADLILALAAALRAVAGAPELPAAHFNLALALESVGLADQGRSEWQTLRHLEREPGWLLAEARHERAIPTLPLAAAPLGAIDTAVQRQDIDALREAAHRWPQDCREYLEERLLIEWSAAVERGDEAANRRLLVASRSIALALRQAHGDTMALDIVAAVRREAASPTSRIPLARSLAAYGRALEQVRQTNFAGALRELREADEILRGLGNPLALRVGCQIATALYHRDDYRQAEALLVPLATEAKRRGYKALHGRCLWVLGLLAGVRGEPTAAFTDFTAALADFTALGEAVNCARVHAFVAEALDLLGQQAGAWRALAPALAENATATDPATRFYVFYTASWLAIEQGDLDVASRLQQEALRFARVSAKPQAVIAAFQRQAFIEALHGAGQDSISSLEQADAALAKIVDPVVRSTLAGDIAVTRGELSRQRSPREALRSFDAAVRIFEATSYHYRLAYALSQRALAEGSLGENRAEERDLAAAVAEAERQRDKVLSREERIAYLDHTRALFEAMIQFQLAQRQPRRAFAYSEEIKARVLLDWLVDQSPGPASQPLATQSARPEVAALLRAIPRDTVLVEYAALKDSLAIFVLRRGELTVVTSRTGAAALGVAVSRLMDALADRGGAARTCLAEIRGLILAPVDASLRPHDRIVFIPDGALHSVPFAALLDRRTGRYLAQDHATSVAPSAVVYLENLRRDLRLAGEKPLRALVIADPAFDREIYPALSRLPGAGTEDLIARDLGGSRVLRGSAATKTAFLDAAPSFEILHFAGHAVINREFPLLSQLLLASEPGDPAHGVLYSGELLGRHLPRTRLVVLASCSTGSGPISATEGVESIARPLLAAGVPAVVASLWDVDDAATAAFIRCFYRRLGESYDVVGALRSAQLDILATGAPPLAWSAFEVIGGSAVAPRP